MLLAVGVGLASAVLPFIAIEVYLLGAAALVDDAQLVGMAVGAAAGQAVGKIVWYYVGLGVLRIPWLQRRAEARGRWSGRVARWREEAEHRPWWTAGLVALSSFASIPPFSVISVLAGTVRMALWSFVLVTFVTRVARFLLLVYTPGVAEALFLT